jgi:5-bromo-4-chloroindolyl phosphate hydrolysis protein
MNANYTTSVFTPAGWRSVTITAILQQITAKTFEVIKVVEIDGIAPTGYTSRTGAKRQTYNAAGIAQREIGLKKRLSSLTLIKGE